VKGRSLVPSPAASTTAFKASPPAISIQGDDIKSLPANPP
jgi:hypothetical protein